MPAATDAQLADLADAVLSLAREIELHLSEDGEVITLTATGRMVLRHLHHRPGSSPTEIGTSLGLKRPNVSEALRQLERVGLIARSHPDGDGRGVVVSITQLAEDNLSRIRQVWARTLAPARNLAADVPALDAQLRQLSAAVTETRTARA
ncbi:MarR family transcriptional regulator [Microbacterium oryzae]|uniref:MarR family winged helix-turn-helix transcriptional regulator n=1 Tax=Microbacterium oryzae TaxID=743009 RepID=UPI0025B0A7C6|nr:MarR family transcriptional regulator [Microbacterium oryzae]MDN3310251.1 MarR family transcriptional regulator [Microbacterium oryzae]